MPLILSRAEEKDLDEIIDAQFRAFEGQDIHLVLYGYNTPSTQENTKKRTIEGMRNDPKIVWTKVVDTETGKIVGAAEWIIYANWAPPREHNPPPIEWMEGGEKHMAEVTYKDFLDRRARYMHGRPHILLALLFTDPNHQKGGAGSLHMKWGTDLADQLMVPLYVEGTPAGHRLYSSYGCKDKEYVNYLAENPDGGRTWESVYTLMKREPSSTSFIKENK